MPNEKLSVTTKELSLNGVWQFRQKGSDNWLPADVPGCNFTDLLANEVIEDPFYRDNEQRLQWIEQADWHYRKHFDIANELLSHTEVELVMDGLDTYCDVYLNGQLIHQNTNMFVGHRIPCKQWLKVGENELRIEFRSPINETMAIHVNNGFTYPAENDKSLERLSVYSRKAPYHFGWDWGPRFVTAGIWRNIKLQAVNSARIDDVYVKQLQVSEELAELEFEVQLASLENFDGTLTLNCDNVAIAAVQSTLPVAAGASLVSVKIKITQPRLWWPNGMGEAFLHQFSLSLTVGQQCLAKKMLSVGIRTIEVVNQPDQYGESFFIKVNGHATFMKGANYIPSDSFLTRVSHSKYQQIFNDAVDANMNMLRVWGGGIYENDEFYQLADQHGILIWQDFMFACSLYPGDQQFIANVEQEVKYNVKRLRNHACLALWCGNNETEMGIEFWQWPTKFDYSDELYRRLKQDYHRLFKQVLPELVSELDGSRFYFSSSPIGFWENKADDNRGDNHFWGVWHGEQPFSEFKRRVPRFMSEYGFQSFPLLNSVKRYAIAEDWHLESSVMKTHQKHPRGNSLIKQYMLEEYSTPKDFESFLYLSQVQQALGMKVAFEAHRCAMPFCMGSLYWQFNDCWPVASWSSIDYYGNWKAMHYQAKRSFAPLAVFIDDASEHLLINLVSDNLQSTCCVVSEQLLTLDGDVIWSHTQQLDLAALNVTQLPSGLTPTMISDLDKSNVLYRVQLSERHQQEAVLSEALHYFVPMKALALKQADIDVRLSLNNEQLQLVLKSDVVARQVHVSFSQNSGNFSDNFFDLLPNSEKIITLPAQHLNDTDLALLQDDIRIMSIVDSHQTL